jgi:NADPH:quinone reductase-like Zn-dependent oxidoreductase
MTALILAKAAGATTIITSSSDEKLEFVKSRYGPDYTINYKTTPDWAAEVLRITNGQGVDHVIEVGGAGTMQQSLKAVAVGGSVSVIGFLTSASKDEQPDFVISLLKKACVLRGILGGSRQQLEEAIGFMNARGLELPVDKTFRFDREEIIAAFNYVASGAHIGKVCITFE